MGIIGCFWCDSVLFLDTHGPKSDCPFVFLAYLERCEYRESDPYLAYVRLLLASMIILCLQPRKAWGVLERNDWLADEWCILMENRSEVSVYDAIIGEDWTQSPFALTPSPSSQYYHTLWDKYPILTSIHHHTLNYCSNFMIRVSKCSYYSQLSIYIHLNN